MLKYLYYNFFLCMVQNRIFIKIFLSATNLTWFLETEKSGPVGNNKVLNLYM